MLREPGTAGKENQVFCFSFKISISLLSFSSEEIRQAGAPADERVRYKLRNAKMERGGFAYITTTKKNTVLYTGSTSNLPVRIYQHKSKEFPGSFTAKYNVDKLVYYEYFHFIEEAIARESQIKSWKREKKVALINKFNPEWKDLYDKVEQRE